MYLEFLGLHWEASYYEKDLEQAIITHLHDFLLELGNGFAFVARQKRLHIEGDEFFIAERYLYPNTRAIKADFSKACMSR